ncbi:MAG: hypothetical protein WCS31_02805 [Verrucomicrobiae bacterium]
MIIGNKFKTGAAEGSTQSGGEARSGLDKPVRRGYLEAMKKFLFFALIALVSGPACGLAFDDIQILPARKKLEEDSARTEKNISIKTKQIVYSVKVTNSSFKEIQNATIKYNIFYQDAQLGSKAEPEVRIASGSESFPSLLSNKAVEFDTKAIELSEGKLDAGWYFTGGGKSSSRDKVVGVWFKAFNAEGKQIGEYTNPSSVTQKRKWTE